MRPITEISMSDHANFNLVFVCTGNTCRSPMAAVIAERSVLRRGWEGVDVRSAGLSAFAGGTASDGARVAAESRGLDLDTHSSAPLDTELVTWATLVLTMGPQHADAAEALGGQGKVFMLSAFSDGGEETRGPGVPDPFGGDAQTYLECFDALDVLVEAALDRVEAEFFSLNKEDTP